MFSLQLSWGCLILLVHPYYARAGIANRTIDDTAGDSVTGRKPIYVPSDMWQDSSCGGCSVKPEPLASAFQGTYSALTYKPEEFEKMSIQLAFKGTAIYVYFILANNVGNEFVTTETFCNFALDGNGAGTFEHTAIPSNSFDFDQLVFQRENLPNDDHTLLISANKGKTDRYGHSYISFDYAKYTFDDTPPAQAPPPQPPTTTTSTSTTTGSSTPNSTSTSTSTSSTFTSSATSKFPTGTSDQPSTTKGSTQTEGKEGSTSSPPDPTTDIPNTSISPNSSHSFPIGAVVGGVVGAIALVFILLLMLWCHRRRKRSTEKGKSNTDASFTIDGHSTVTQEPSSSDRSRVRLPTSNAAGFLLSDTEDSSGDSGEQRQHRRAERGMRKLHGVASDDTTKPYRAASPPSELRPVRREGQETVEMRTQLHAMAREIEHLQTQLNSNSARRIQSYDPPPEYTSIV